MEVRLMKESDLEQVAEIEKASFSKPWSYRAFKKALDMSNYIYVVGVANREVLGYGGVYCVLNEANITNVAVKDKIRNRGIGYGILVGLIEEVKKAGMDSITLEVRESNNAAIHLYEQLGFESVGIRKDFYDKPNENAVIMWKRNL